MPSMIENHTNGKQDAWQTANILRRPISKHAKKTFFLSERGFGGGKKCQFLLKRNSEFCFELYVLLKKYLSLSILW